ncbi:hypothetical protein CFC21_105179, partial [Triticum aestivum]
GIIFPIFRRDPDASKSKHQRPADGSGNAQGRGRRPNYGASSSHGDGQGHVKRGEPRAAPADGHGAGVPGAVPILHQPRQVLLLQSVAHRGAGHRPHHLVRPLLLHRQRPRPRPEALLRHRHATRFQRLQLLRRRGDAAVDSRRVPEAPHPAARLRTVFTALVFLTVAFSDVALQNCFFPSAGRNTEELLKNLPLGIAFLSSFVFMIFPAKRKGFGYSDTTPRQKLT